MTPDDPRHGQPRGFHAHRSDGEDPCTACRDAFNRYERRRRKSRTLYQTTWEIDATGTRRRLQALYWLGWRGVDIGERIGCTKTRIDQLARDQQRHVLRHTAAAVADVYAELCMTLGPSPITAARARAKGYLPPLAWENIDDPDERPRLADDRNEDSIDEAAIERVLAGDIVPTTFAERVEITRRWQARGRSLSELERVTGWKSDRYIVRGDAA